MLLPGEIEDISREIEKLSGYRVVTLKEIKKISTDSELNLMYYLLEKNVMPGHFYRMPPGEKQLIRAFCEQECNGGQV
ncbi:MAG: hypothetical protein ACLRX7_06850 [Acutalibacteraceae bacterium]